jgi:hypothetical protein
MTATVVVLSARRYPEPLRLTEAWPDGSLTLPSVDGRFVRYVVTEASLAHRFADHPFRNYRFGTWHEDGELSGLVIYRRTRLRGVPAASLLGAYGEDVPELLVRWAGAVRRVGLPIVHVVTSPASPIRSALSRIGTRFTVPLSRNPYHLIARALRDDSPPVLFQLDRWDCVGGDIL